jgi:poly-gamma-glutamate capsule biosynthesis protein CapA/YwtB (metallophosphatase superfamily)
LLAKSDNSGIVFYAVGDIGPEREDPGSIFQNVAGVINSGDVALCQLEVNLSHRGAGPQGKEVARNPEIAAAIKKTGFDVVSFAGNHTLEVGLDSFYDTIDNLKRQELMVLGVGKDIDEARKPVIIERKGTRIAFLGYSSVAKEEHYAGRDRPGSAPLRAWTFYEAMEPTQPGTPGRVHTFPYRNDLAAMVEDVRKARKMADVVIVSMHCGVHMTPALIAGYQKDYAHAAIDSGADLVVQHHAHILKGIEIYSGKAIFYGLANFALEIHFMTREWAQIPGVKELRRNLNPDWNPPYENYPSYPFPPDSRKTIVAKCEIRGKKVDRVSFLPVYITPEGEPEILNSNDARFNDVMNYMKDISADQGLTTEFTVKGNEVVVK